MTEKQPKDGYYIRGTDGAEIKKATASTPIMDKADLFRITEAFKNGTAAVKAPHEKYLILWELSIGLGFRISDTLKLTVSDVTTPDAEVIEQKTQKRRMIVLNDRLQALVDAYIEKYHLRPDDKLIFANRKDGSKTDAIDKSQAYRKMREIVEAVCPNIRFSNHTCRKSWAYALYIANNRNIAIVQKALNHSSSLITADYIGLSKKELKETLMNFDPLA